MPWRGWFWQLEVHGFAVGVEAHPDHGTAGPLIKAVADGVRPTPPVRLVDFYAMPLQPEITRILLQIFGHLFWGMTDGAEEFRKLVANL